MLKVRYNPPGSVAGRPFIATGRAAQGGLPLPAFTARAPDEVGHDSAQRPGAQAPRPLRAPGCRTRSIKPVSRPGVRNPTTIEAQAVICSRLAAQRRAPVGVEPHCPAAGRTSAIAGRPLAPGDQRRHGWQAVGEQVAERPGHEVRRAEDVGHELTLAQGVEGGDVRASRAGLQLIDAAPLGDDEAEARGDGRRAGTPATAAAHRLRGHPRTGPPRAARCSRRSTA